MKISYKKLWILLIEKDISPATLRKDLNIATGTMTKMRRNEEVALSVLLRICEYLDCNIGDICDAVKTDTNELNFTIGDDKNSKLKGGMMMSAPIVINGVSIASLALVGPKRIDYANVAAALKFIVNQIDNAKGGKNE